MPDTMTTLSRLSFDSTRARVKQLTVADLQKIFLASDDAPKKWSDVDPEWPATDLKVYSPGTDSGTFDYFKEVLVGKDKSKSMRADMQVSEQTDGQPANPEKRHVGEGPCALVQLGALGHVP